ncbi:uncharacterized protein LOC111542346 [Piliocolobus tephrosceles]|uniref:uncharacterized protein LOC111542346 n=1 Tax=Piliocolobus tephrosceles TaxID=591936 RepID=UPI000C2A84E3|nr:uncharacterized protein LOC111542346 [Piliocolobus tephrosceles]
MTFERPIVLLSSEDYMTHDQTKPELLVFGSGDEFLSTDGTVNFYDPLPGRKYLRLLFPQGPPGKACPQLQRRSPLLLCLAIVHVLRSIRHKARLPASVCRPDDVFLQDTPSDPSPVQDTPLTSMRQTPTWKSVFFLYLLTEQEFPSISQTKTEAPGAYRKELEVPM